MNPVRVWHFLPDIATREIYASYRRSVQEAILSQNDARFSGRVHVL
jgi:hypothetical protein